MKRAQWALAGLVGVLALVVAVTAEAQVVTGGKPAPTLKADVIKASKQKEEIVDNGLLPCLGPAFLAQLQAGRAVEIPGVGCFGWSACRSTRNLAGGRPVVVPARSYVEFAPAVDVTAAANAPGAVPNKNVQGYEFRVNPNAASGLKTENARNPGIRTRLSRRRNRLGCWLPGAQASRLWVRQNSGQHRCLFRSWAGQPLPAGKNGRLPILVV